MSWVLSPSRENSHADLKPESIVLILLQVTLNDCLMWKRCDPERFVLFKLHVGSEEEWPSTLPIHLWDCEQDYMRTTEQITTKPGGRMWYGSGKNPLHFGGDPNFSLSLKLRNFVDFSKNNSLIRHI